MSDDKYLRVLHVDVSHKALAREQCQCVCVIMCVCACMMMCMCVHLCMHVVCRTKAVNVYYNKHGACCHMHDELYGQSGFLFICYFVYMYIHLA